MIQAASGQDDVVTGAGEFEIDNCDDDSDWKGTTVSVVGHRSDDR